MKFSADHIMKISIGMPVYNAGMYLDCAIKSIFAQNTSDWELIIIDDGSTDNSLEVAKKYESDSVRVYSDGLNKKLPYRLNQILGLARYDFIARMDADDIMMPGRLKAQLDYLMNNPEKDLVSTGIVSINNSNMVLGFRYTAQNFNASFLDLIEGRSGIIHASILARKSWFERNLYNETNIQAEDYQLWLSAFSKNDLKIGYIESLLYCYREDQNITMAKMLRSYRQQIKIIEEIDSNKLFVRSKIKFQIKILLAKVIFYFKAERFLLDRRLSKFSDRKKFLIQQEINKIIT